MKKPYNPAQLRISIKELKNYYFFKWKIDIPIVEDIQFINNKSIIDIFVKEGPTFYITNLYHIYSIEKRKNI